MIAFGLRPQRNGILKMLSKDLSARITDVLIEACNAYFEKEMSGESFPRDIDVSFQITKDSKNGDLTSNVAMRLAKPARRAPLAIAEGLIELMGPLLEKAGISGLIEKIEQRAGFINLYFSAEYYCALLEDVKKHGSLFGMSDEGKGKKFNLEFVSANPTGPLTIAHGRQAAIGDTLSRILRFNGYDVTNEYYLNDAGRQINLLAKSVSVRYRNICGMDDEMPEDGYMGEYIKDIAREIKLKKGESLLEKSPQTDDFFREYAVKYMMVLITKDLDDFGVVFDTWTSQGGIEARGEVEKTLELMADGGHIYEKDGAKWFASTPLGDDKDRVVIKSDGSYTYLAPDIAYHMDKYRRGYDRLIDFLGPDHHGYIKRMKAAVQALGHDAGSLDILIVQLVTLMRGGESVSMSTRAGEFISLREILDEVGKDVTRFFFLSRRLDSHLDFDIELAKKESADNPVFYIQYAHARICSIKKYSRKSAWRLFFRKPRLDLLKGSEEKQLIRKLAEFPFAVRAGAETLEPNKLVVYLNELSRLFHSFYTECRVISEDAGLSKARLYLVECVRIVLANGLNLLNITLPEKM